MIKPLRIIILVLTASFVVGCAQQSPLQRTVSATAAANSNLGRRHHVRTTAYTRTERGGSRNAVGQYLSGRHIMSAASDWSRYPLGTRFRIVDTNEEFIIDDYGTALVGTNTIDLYKPTRLAMRKWGVRHVDIDILQWGSPEQSLKVLRPRKKHSTVRRMIVALQKNAGSTSPPLN